MSSIRLSLDKIDVPSKIEFFHSNQSVRVLTVNYVGTPTDVFLGKTAYVLLSKEFNEVVPMHSVFGCMPSTEDDIHYARYSVERIIVEKEKRK